MEIRWKEHILEFLKPARTSRGEYLTKNVLVVELVEGENSWKGEASPLPDLSIDGGVDLVAVLEQNLGALQRASGIAEIQIILKNYPSLQFALECCILGKMGHNGLLFQSSFTRGGVGIPINGLVWMEDLEAMEKSAFEKIEQGFSCLKFKVGAMDHDNECKLIEKVRKDYRGSKIQIRLDANGAFSEDDALLKIKDFAKFGIHSIEQPVAADNWDIMQEICRKSTLPVALDEELIGIDVFSNGEKLVKYIGAAFLILKPTLLGGFSNCNEWINLANRTGMGWWVTSALESNLGLGHIAQWVSTKENKLYQGLGTGNLFKNNFSSQTKLKGEEMWYLSGSVLN